MAAAIGLRHPASASCLGRHLRFAGRCPNNSSLFPPLAAVVVVALWPYSAEKLFYNFGIPERLRTLRYAIFTGRVWNELPQSKPDGFASSLWEGAFGMAALFLAEAQSLRAYPLPLGGAVAQRLRGFKWRSEKSVKAIAPTGAALAFLCFDFFFRIVKGEQPLARCGVGGVQR